MDKSAFITQLYSKVNEAFLRNMDEKDRPAASEAYLDYLHKAYDDFISSVKESQLNKAAMVCVNKEKTLHLELSAEAKQAFLFPDPSFLRLQDLSFEIAGLASAKKRGEAFQPERTKEEYLDQLREYEQKTAPAFQHSAARMLSEALMDIRYIFDDDSAQSFRTSVL